MRNVSEKKRFKENQNTFYIRYLFFKNRAVHEIMWKATVDPGRPHVII